MLRFIILFISLLTLSFAEPIVKINSDSSNILDFDLAYFISDNPTLKLEDVQSKQFTKGSNKDSLGANVTDVWIKIKLFNATQNRQIISLHQDLAYTFINIEYFEVANDNSLINKQTITPFGPLAEEELNGSDAIYKFTLHPNETKTIYVHQISPAYHFYNFSIFTEKESIQYLIYEKVDSVLLVGLLMALALYNLLIYVSSRYKEYLYYSLYLISYTLWIFYMYGAMAHYLHMYGEIPLRFNFGLMIGPMFLSLFVQAIFNTKQEYIKEHHFLNSIIALLSLNFIYGLIDFESALQILSLALNYSMIVFLGVAISIYLKGNKIIKIFLFAHIFYLTFNVYALLFYMGMVDSTYISSHGIGIGIAIEALMLSYLVSYKFKIMEQEKEEDRLKQVDLRLLAVTDPMTKLYNRRYFAEISENVIAMSKRKKEDLSIIMLDIDKFKCVNDTYGHQFGDEVIVALSSVLLETQRKSDVVCRYGGEEFVILLPNTSLNATIGVAEKIRSLVETSTLRLASNEEFKFTISLGVARVDVQNEEDIESALKRADEALYEAKENGRNKVCRVKI